MSAGPWKVGEVAKRTGLSVRTLHHYHAIGLLAPSRRSHAGYRLYTVADVARLQQITSLRALGFSLKEIRTLLDHPDVSPRHVIELHIGRLKEQMEVQRELCRRLESIADHLSSAEEVSADDLFHAMELTNMTDKIKTYYTPEQLETLERRRRELGEDEIKRVEAEWPDLIARVRVEMERGTDPADERVQALGRRWKSLVDSFTGGDPGIARSLETMYRNEPDVRRQGGLDPDLTAYVGEVLSATKSE